jgi:hypothetical protein
MRLDAVAPANNGCKGTRRWTRRTHCLLHDPTLKKQLLATGNVLLLEGRQMTEYGVSVSTRRMQEQTERREKAGFEPVGHNTKRPSEKNR